ncbi:hypothetical protein [Paenibacillus jilunlii]|nr:hypothetical protein [Paenibacillus jilunlii]
MKQKRDKKTLRGWYRLLNIADAEIRYYCLGEAEKPPEAIAAGSSVS